MKCHVCELFLDSETLIAMCLDNKQMFPSGLMENSVSLNRVMSVY